MWKKFFKKISAINFKLFQNKKWKILTPLREEKKIL